MTETPHLATETAQAEQAPTGVLGTLGLSPSLFAGQLLNFVIVLVVMWYFVYRPLVKKMDERSKKIQDGLSFAQDAEGQLQRANEEREQLIREARAESRVLIDDASAKAEALRQEKLALAKSEIEKVVAEAKEQIRNERAAAFEALRTDIAQLVSQLTAKVVKNLDEKTQHQLIADAIKEIEKA